MSSRLTDNENEKKRVKRMIVNVGLGVCFFFIPVRYQCDTWFLILVLFSTNETFWLCRTQNIE